MDTGQLYNLTEIAILTINGNKVDPRTVDVCDAPHSVSHDFEIRIRSAILLHELQEVDVQIPLEALPAFVREDLKTHGAVAMKGYLQIVQSISHQEDRKAKFFGIFQRKPRTIPIHWGWGSAQDVHLDDSQYLVIKGKCEKLT